MLIGIDGNEANVKNRVGVNTYAFELLKALKKTQDEWKDKHNFVILLKDAPLKELPKESNYWKYRVLPGKGLWIITQLMPYLFKTKEKPEVLFSPSHYVPPFSPIPRICSIMDLGYLESSEQFKKRVFWQLKYWTATSIKVSKKVIAISEATKKDIVRHYPSASEKIVVTHLAFDNELFNQSKYENNVRRKNLEKVYEKYSIDKEYLLYLGTLKPSKNVEGVVKAFKIIDEKYPNKYKLVIAGKKGWFYEEIYKEVERLDLADKVIFTGFITEEEKVALLYGAKLLTTPSFWEGFGLHVLEAFASGTPVVSSRKGSLPEVGGDVAVYVDPIKPQSIAKGMSTILNMSRREYSKLTQKGQEWADTFSWKKTARETLKAIESVK